jgi:hypothetical protein
MNERVKEIREWATFALTALTVAVVPLGLLIMSNQKLEIQKEADSKYQTRMDAHDFQETTNNKLDKLADGMAAVQTDVASIKGHLARKDMNP